MGHDYIDPLRYAAAQGTTYVISLELAQQSLGITFVVYSLMSTRSVKLSYNSSFSHHPCNDFPFPFHSTYNYQKKAGSYQTEITVLTEHCGMIQLLISGAWHGFVLYMCHQNGHDRLTLGI